MRKLTHTVVLVCILSVFSYFGIKSDSDFFRFFDKLLSYESDLKNEETSEVANEVSEDLLEVNFVDVGQGDCCVVILPNNEVMMIDAGENGHEDEVFEFLDSKGIDEIDYLVATHPHSDHIGGMPEVIGRYKINNFYMPKAVHTSKTFERMIDALSEKNMKINTATTGKTIIDNGELNIVFVAPVNKAYEDLNNYSAVIRMSYKDKSFIFCGDAEELAENEIIDAGVEINSDVLKVAHHGSSTSSSDKFLKGVSPEISVISCGENNDYNHPHREILKAVNDISDVYRTDKNGTVTITTDGYKLNCSTQY